MPHQDVSLGFQVVDLARTFRQQFERAVAESGLEVTAGEARTLFYAAKAGRIRQAGLAAQMQVEPMSLSNFLDRLECRGLISRTTDPADRRAKLVEVTPKASPLVAHLRRIATTVRDRSTAGLRPEEIRMLGRCLAAMRRNLSATGEELPQESSS